MRSLTQTQSVDRKQQAPLPLNLRLRQSFERKKSFDMVGKSSQMRQEHSSLMKEGQYLQPHFRQSSNQRYPQPSKQPMVRIHKANNRAQNYIS